AAMAGAAPAHDSPLLFARALTARRGDLAAWRYVEAARRQRPDDPFWTVHAAAIRLGAGDTTFADTALARFVPRSADAALLAGLVAAKRGQADRARSPRLVDAARAARVRGAARGTLRRGGEGVPAAARFRHRARRRAGPRDALPSRPEALSPGPVPQRLPDLPRRGDRVVHVA